ncbi:MAG: desulfoferrodoxin [Clostridia bacterium]|nr:desulfoferrodoxin [Clostridia bacterium]
MKKDYVLKRCNKCGALVEAIVDCTCENCGIRCCGEPMETLVPNSVDCDEETHIPTYELVGEFIVASVPHVMEEDHHITTLLLEGDNVCLSFRFGPKEKPQATFPHVPGSTLYAYCNKHGLWKKDVE